MVIRDVAKGNFKRQSLLRNFIMKNIDQEFQSLEQVVRFILQSTEWSREVIKFNWLKRKLRIKIEFLILSPTLYVKIRAINAQAKLVIVLEVQQMHPKDFMRNLNYM